MTDAVITALILNGTTALIAAGGWLQSWRNTQRAKLQTAQLNNIGVSTDGSLTALKAELSSANQAIKLSDQRLEDLQVVVTRLLADKLKAETH